MEAQELRQFNAEELRGRIKQWREELFRAEFKKLSNEVKDTSLFRKLRNDIARALHVLGEKERGVEIKAKERPAKTSAAKKAKEPKAEGKEASKEAKEK